MIRIGLQPTENILPGKDVAAGPFHPSMRHLVESLVYREMLAYMLGKLGPELRKIKVTVNPKAVSELIGNKKSNIAFLKGKFFIDKIEIYQDNCVEAGTIMLDAGETSVILSKKDYYSMVLK